MNSPTPQTNHPTREERDAFWCYFCDRPRVQCVCADDPNGLPDDHWSLMTPSIFDNPEVRAASRKRLLEMTATPPRAEGAYGYTPRPSLWYGDECQGPSDQPTVNGLCPSCAASWESGGKAVRS